MAHKWSHINIAPVVYDKDTNNDFVLNTNNDRIIINDQYTEIASSDDYTAKVQIQEYPYWEYTSQDPDLKYILPAKKSVFELYINV
jgi:hypothetical protein